MTSLVSVVLPTRDRAALLPRALRSVLGQSHPDLELIVVDDGSSDATREVVAACADARVRYVRGPGGEGPAGARNRGVALARGALIAFQDSDDEWLPTKLQRQLALLAEAGPHVGLVVCEHIVVEPGKARLVRCPALARGRTYEDDMLRGHPLATPTWLVRRDALAAAGPFDTTLPALEDWDLALRLHAVTGMRAVAEPLLVKYGHPAAVSADRRRHLRALRELHRRHAPLWRARPSREAALLESIGRLECGYGSRRAGIAALAGAVRRAPWRPAHYWALAAALVGRAALKHAGARLARSGPAA